MNDTYLTIIGTALTRPEKRVLERSNTLVASFRVISNARRFDSNTGQWVDAPNLRVRVNCWRRLGEHVLTSINSGDAVVVYGRISTKDWTTADGEARISFEVDADSVGHDLNRGLATFTRMRLGGPTTVVDDEESDLHINGEIARPLDDPGEPLVATQVGADARAEAYGLLQRAGLNPGGGTGVEDDEVEAEVDDDDESDDEEELVGAASGLGGPGPRGRRRGR